MAAMALPLDATAEMLGSARAAAAVAVRETERRAELQAARTAAEVRADLVLQQMRMDLDAANERIRGLLRERSTLLAQRELYQEVRDDREAARKEGMAAAREVEALRRSLEQAQDRLREAESEKKTREQVSQQLFSLESAKKQVEEDLSAVKATAQREKTVLVLQAEKAELARKAAEDGKAEALRINDSMQQAHTRQLKSLDTDRARAEAAAEVDVRRLQEALKQAEAKASRVDALDVEVLRLRRELAEEQQTARREKDALRAEVERAKRDSEDWRSALEAAEAQKARLTKSAAELAQSRELLAEQHHLPPPPSRPGGDSSRFSFPLPGSPLRRPEVRSPLRIPA